MEPTIFTDEMAFDKYIEVDACHKSALSHVKTAKHLKKYQDKKPDSDALRFGRIFHTSLLEPGNIGALEVYEDMDWIPKADHPDGKSINDQKAEWKQTRNDNEIPYFMKNQERIDLENMVKAIREHPLASKYLKPEAKIEGSLFWKDERTGLDCKSRLDLILPDDDIIIEIKTDVDPEPEAFGRKIYNMGYHIGAWFNREGYRAVFGRDLKAFIFVVLEKSEPYSVGVYMMSAHDFDAGEIDGVPLMMRYKLIKAGGLQDHNQKEDGSFEVLPVQTPKWVQFKLDGDGDIDAPAPSESEGEL